MLWTYLFRIIIVLNTKYQPQLHVHRCHTQLHLTRFKCVLTYNRNIYEIHVTEIKSIK